MDQRNLEQRVTKLEEQMQQLTDVPVRLSAVESQILQLRGDIDREVSAIQQRVDEGDTDGRRFSRVLFEEALARIRLLREDENE